MSWFNLRIPPLLLTLLFALFMWLVSLVSPKVLLPITSLGLAAFLFLAAMACVAAGWLSFRGAQTTVNPIHPQQASRLVVVGIYRYSRNPMYLGFAMALSGWALLLAAPVNLLLVAVFVGYLSYFQIKAEEHALRLKFGQDYDDYCQHVRRWC